METETIFTRFESFLKEEGVYEQFYKNLKELNPDPVNLLATLKADRVQRYLSAAFIWADSPEGDGFWRDLERKWLSIAEAEKLAD